MNSNFPEWLLWAVPTREETIHVDIAPQRSRQLLAEKFMTEITVEPSSFLVSKTRYRGSIDGNIFYLKGPFGYKRWRLETRGEIVEAPGGSEIKLSMRFETGPLVFMALALVVYVVVALEVMQLWVMWPYVVIQVLLIYGVILFNFRYEASLIKKLIQESVTESKLWYE